jgi:hypothetical protein
MLLNNKHSQFFTTLSFKSTPQVGLANEYLRILAGKLHYCGISYMLSFPRL